MGIALVSLTTSGKKHRSMLARVSVVAGAALAAIATPIVVFQRSPQSVQLSLYDGLPAQYRDGDGSTTSRPEPSAQPDVGAHVASTEPAADTTAAAPPSTDGPPADPAADTSSPPAETTAPDTDAAEPADAAPPSTESTGSAPAPDEPAQDVPADEPPLVVLPSPDEDPEPPEPGPTNPSPAASSSSGKGSANSSKSNAPTTAKPNSHGPAKSAPPATTASASKGGAQSAPAPSVVLPAPAKQSDGSSKPLEQRIDTLLGTLVVRIEPGTLTLVHSKPAYGWTFEASKPAPHKLVVRGSSARSTHEITLTLEADGKTTVHWTPVGGGRSDRSDRRG